MKTKNYLKVLLILVLILIAICLFNTSTVKAVTEEEGNAILSKLGDTVKIDIAENDASILKGEDFDFEAVSEIVAAKVREELKDESLEGWTLDVSWYVEDIHKYYVALYASTDTDFIEASKIINVKYANTPDTLDSAKQAKLNKVIENLDFVFWQSWQINYESIDIAEEYKNLGDGITVAIVRGENVSTEAHGLYKRIIHFFVDGVCYDTKEAIVIDTWRLYST